MKSKQHQFIEIDKQIGAKICSLRQRKGWSAQEFAKKIGVSHQQVRKYERGINAIKIGQLLFLAKFFEIGIDYFIDTANDFSDTTLKQQRICHKIVNNLSKIKNPLFHQHLNSLIITLGEDKK